MVESRKESKFESLVKNQRGLCQIILFSFLSPKCLVKFLRLNKNCKNCWIQSRSIVSILKYCLKLGVSNLHLLKYKKQICRHPELFSFLQSSWWSSLSKRANKLLEKNHWKMWPASFSFQIWKDLALKVCRNGEN